MKLDVTILTFQILTIFQKQYVEDHVWLPGHNILLHVGVFFCKSLCWMNNMKIREANKKYSVWVQPIGIYHTTLIGAIYKPCGSINRPCCTVYAMGTY